MPAFHRPMSTGQIASYLQMSVEVVNKWIREGKLKAYRTPGGRYRVEEADFIDFLKEHDLPVDEEYFGLQKKTVMIVDDDQAVVRTLSLAMAELGDFEIVTAHDGVYAGYLLAQSSPALVILDICMPGMDGLSLCKFMRSQKETQDTPILIVSGFIDEEALRVADEYNIYACLPKPVSMARFYEAAADAMEIEAPEVNSGAK